MTTLPKALLEELPEYSNERRKYNAKELVLALMANFHPAGVTTKDMMIYVYRANKTVMKRNYLYQMLYRLRKAGLVGAGTPMTTRPQSAHSRMNEGTKYFHITEEGRLVARPYIPVTD